MAFPNCVHLVFGFLSKIINNEKRKNNKGPLVPVKKIPVEKLNLELASEMKINYSKKVLEQKSFVTIY